jgi:hypothetical protein
MPRPDSRHFRKLGAHAQAMLEWSLDAVISADERGVILAWNRQAEAVFGWKREEIEGRLLVETIVPPSQRAAHLEGLRRFLNTGQQTLLNRRIEVTGLRKDGTEIPVELTIVPEPVRRGWIFTAFIRNLAEERRVQQALVETEERFRSAFHNAGTGMCLVGLDGRFLEVNRPLCALLGYREEDLLTMRFSAVTHPEDRSASLELARRMIGGELESARLEKRYIHRDGRVIFAVIATSLLRGRGGAARCFVTQVQDLTARRVAEEALRESEEKFRGAFEHAGIGMCLLSPEGRFIQVNPRLCRMLEVPEGELMGREAAEFTHPEDREATKVTLRRLLEEGRVEAEMGTRYVRRDGREVWAHLTASVVRGPAGEPRYIVAEIQDVTRRKLAEEELSRSEKTYRNLFENNPGPMWVFDLETHRFLAVNDAAVEKYGYTRSEFRGMTIFDVRPPHERARLRRLLETRGAGTLTPEEWIHRTKDGKEFWVEVTAHKLRFEGREAVLVAVSDLTERRRAEEALRRSESQLQQSAKMEAIGRLAGGIAHDFNNLLTVIQGFAQLLAKKGPGTAELDEIRQAAARGAALTHQLLAFSRRQVMTPQVIDLNARVTGMDLMLRRVIGENIELALRLEPGLASVTADPGQVDQVILNLVLNARDAMPGGGRLTIETRGSSGPEPAGGPWVTLIVSDTGAGMDAATLTHIFEPFFTTKEGRGTGLGLATVYGIVQQSGGQVRVASEPGRGASFRVFLPATASIPARPELAAATGPWRGAETILVVEDDPAVRSLLSALLRQNGYAVLVAEDAEQALALSEADPRPIHIVVSDVVLPRLPGPEMVRRLRHKRPGIRALFMSGHVDDSLARPGALTSDEGFLPKPFTDEALTRRVRELLDSRAPLGR